MIAAAEFAALVVLGFVGCAEFGSAAFVHPVLRHLDPAAWLRVEKGLLATFGRVMPVAMPLAAVLTIVAASIVPGSGAPLRWIAVAVVGLSIVTTVIGNVPINITTGRWDPDNPPENWRAIRRRWERLQLLRGSLQLIGFILLAAAATLA